MSAAAGLQIQAIIGIGQSVEKSQNNGTLTKLEHDTLQSMEKSALEGILSAYEAIGIVVAEQATATCNILATALRAPGLAFI